MQSCPTHPNLSSHCPWNERNSNSQKRCLLWWNQNNSRFQDLFLSSWFSLSVSVSAAVTAGVEMAPTGSRIGELQLAGEANADCRTASPRAHWGWSSSTGNTTTSNTTTTSSITVTSDTTTTSNTITTSEISLVVTTTHTAAAATARGRPKSASHSSASGTDANNASEVRRWLLLLHVVQPNQIDCKFIASR